MSNSISFSEKLNDYYQKLSKYSEEIKKIDNDERRQKKLMMIFLQQKRVCIVSTNY